MTAELVDDSAWAGSRWAHLINIKRQNDNEKVVSFAFKSYGKGSPQVRNAAGFELDVVEASVASLEFIYIHSATMKLVNYFLGFIDVQKLAMKLAAWPANIPSRMCRLCETLSSSNFVENGSWEPISRCTAIS